MCRIRAVALPDWLNVVVTVASEPSSGAAPDPARAAAENPLVAQVQEITGRTFSATSPDGHVTVTAGGDQRLREVMIHTTDAPPGIVSRAATVAANEALTAARRATVAAMRELPGLTGTTRRLLGGEA